MGSAATVPPCCDNHSSNSNSNSTPFFTSRNSPAFRLARLARNPRGHYGTSCKLRSRPVQTRSRSPCVARCSPAPGLTALSLSQRPNQRINRPFRARETALGPAPCELAAGGRDMGHVSHAPCKLGGWLACETHGSCFGVLAGVGLHEPANAHMRAEWAFRGGQAGGQAAGRASGQVRAQRSEVADLQAHLAANPVVGGRQRKARRVLDLLGGAARVQQRSRAANASSTSCSHIQLP
jgi:hypothetical protein